MDPIDPKNPQKAKIRKGDPKRDSKCFQTLQDITIPAGTILRDYGDDEFSAGVGTSAYFTVRPRPGEIVDPALFKAVIA